MAEAKAAGFDAFDVWGSGAKEGDLARWQSLAARHGLGVGVEFGPNRVGDVEEGIAVAKRLGSVYLDAHVASYFLPERDAEALLRGLVERARAAGMPLVIQTHRGPGRAGPAADGRLRARDRRPAVRRRLLPLRRGRRADRAAPARGRGGVRRAVERATMLDGRVSNGEQVQVDFTNPAYRAHAERTSALWKRVMVRWLRGARPGDVFPFRVELGPPDYAILGADGREISDRWALQKQMKALVERLWNEAVAETGRGEARAAAR